MAVVENGLVYGYNTYLDSNRYFSFQYHITVQCDQKCSHCYQFEDTHYKNQLDNPLDIDEMHALIDEIYCFAEKYNLFVTMAITGGDPILSVNFWPLLEYMQRYSDRLGTAIMGNPFHINHEVARKLKNLNVMQYQISLDGMKETHDAIRKKGSFDASIEALKVLHDVGIPTMAMLTVSKSNCSDIIPLIDYINTLPFIDGISFDRMIPMGNASKEEVMSSAEHRQLLFDILKHETLSPQKIFAIRKDNLWKPLMEDIGLAMPFNTGNKIKSGCYAARNSMTILADGTLFACRRLNLAIGKWPKDKLENTFVNNPILNSIRQYKDYNGCKDCTLKQYCRGCLGMKYAFHQNIYGQDPGCWRCNDVPE